MVSGAGFRPFDGGVAQGLLGELDRIRSSASNQRPLWHPFAMPLVCSFTGPEPEAVAPEANTGELSR
jgi:hypothetical protein